MSSSLSRRGKKDQARETLTPEEENVILQRELESVKMRLSSALVRADEAESHMRTHRLMLSDLQADFETEKKRSFDIIADMTRQYKALREDFARQTQRLTNEISTYKDKLADAQRAYAELERIKDSDLALKDVEIAEHKRRMDRMGEDFTLMLQDTLNKMSEKITITTHWNLDQDNPVVRTFEDHALVDSKLRARADAVGQHQQGAGKRP